MGSKEWYWVGNLKRELLPSSLGAADATSEAPFPRWEKEARQQTLKNGWSAISGALFRKRELTEFCGRLGEFCEKTR